MGIRKFWAPQAARAIGAAGAGRVAKQIIRSTREGTKAASELSSEQLINKVGELRKKNQISQAPEKLIPEVFALLDVVLQRHLGMSAYDVQLTAGHYLTQRRIVEMATGEGKTLTALFPLFYWALQGKGVLLATANDYLARRDAEFAESVFSHLGVSVGAVADESTDNQRIEAYAKDITYGTATQFGFDFLKDRAKTRFNKSNPALIPEKTVQRKRLFSIIVDEVDSLLIDDAATPLIISSAPPPIGADKINAIKLVSRIAPEAIEGTHYLYLKIEKKPELTNAGRIWITKQAVGAGKSSLSLIDWYELAERAIQVHRDFKIEKNYLLAEDGEILLVDQGTGRIGKGRQWGDGIHQAIQAKENLPITAPTGLLAKVTLQSFFLSFENLSGMTGTASSSANEFKGIYDIRITQIPTHRKNKRIELAPQCFPDDESLLKAILEECRTMIQRGRSVLIGARNVRYSERISSCLSNHGIDNLLLNARHDATEASVVGQAGQPGRVTVATNMAGRGTDIELHADVKSNGGLHVILGGIHESPRIDRQLLGRSARQGDPGSYRIMISLEDDLLDDAFSVTEAKSIRDRLRRKFSTSTCLKIFQQAQERIALRGEVDRRMLFHQEKKQLKYLSRAGMDPLLDFPG